MMRFVLLRRDEKRPILWHFFCGVTPIFYCFFSPTSSLSIIKLQQLPSHLFTDSLVWVQLCCTSILFWTKLISNCSSYLLISVLIAQCRYSCVAPLVILDRIICSCPDSRAVKVLVNKCVHVVCLVAGWSPEQPSYVIDILSRNTKTELLIVS